MRLIDADKIVNYQVTADDGKRYVLLPVEKLSDIPTAYDVEKVVEELERKKALYDINFQGWSASKIQDAIDIVKRGELNESEP